MVLNLLIKNVHIDKKLQIILLKKYFFNLKYLSKNKLNSFLFKTGYINFPIKRKLYTVLASPHINKKAREQFYIVKYSKGLKISLDKNISNKILNYFFFYNNFMLNSLLKNYYNNLYLKNNYFFVLNKNNKKKNSIISIKYSL